MIEQFEILTTGKAKVALESADRFVTPRAPRARSRRPPTSRRSASASPSPFDPSRRARRYGGSVGPDERRRHTGLADPCRPDLERVVGQRRDRPLRHLPQRRRDEDRVLEHRHVLGHEREPEHDVHLHDRGRRCCRQHVRPGRRRPGDDAGCSAAAPIRKHRRSRRTSSPSAVSPTLVDLTWNASSDNVGDRSLRHLPQRRRDEDRLLEHSDVLRHDREPEHDVHLHDRGRRCSRQHVRPERPPTR